MLLSFFTFFQIYAISYDVLKRLNTTESLEPAIDCPLLNGIPLG